MPDVNVSIAKRYYTSASSSPAFVIGRMSQTAQHHLAKLERGKAEYFNKRIAKLCESYGCRVQNSVFELLLEPTQIVTLKAKIETIIVPDKDSVRLYRLGSNWRPKIETLGRGLRYEQDGMLML